MGAASWSCVCLWAVGAYVAFIAPVKKRGKRRGIEQGGSHDAVV